MAKTKAQIQRELDEKLKELDELKKKTNDSNLAPQEVLKAPVPNLPPLTPETTKQFFPKFNEKEFIIKDPLNPQLPGVSEAQYLASVENYKGANRALDLYGMGFDTTGKLFNVLGKRAKAIGAGIDAATETEKARYSFLGYQKQLQDNNQAAIALDLAAYKTSTEAQKATFTKKALDYSLEEAEVKSQAALNKLEAAKSKADSLRQGISDYIEAEVE